MIPQLFKTYRYSIILSSMFISGYLYVKTRNFVHLGSLMAFFGILCYNFQDVVLYARFFLPESKVKIPSYLNVEEIYLKTVDGENLHCYFCKSQVKSSDERDCIPTVLFFHGNAGTIKDRMFVMDLFYKMYTFNILMVEYRGYGKSTGYPSEEGLYTDVDTAYEYICQRDGIFKNNIILYGHSLGGGVVIGAMHRWYMNQRANKTTDKETYKTYTPKHWPMYVIIQNSFTSVRQIGKALYTPLSPLIASIPDFYIKNKFTSIEKIGYIVQPILFFSSLTDDIVPPYMMQDLYKASKTDFKKIYTFPDCDHNSLFLHEDFSKRIMDFHKDACDYISSQ